MQCFSNRRFHSAALQQVFISLRRWLARRENALIFCLENPAGEGGGVGVQHFADRYTDCKAWKPRLLGKLRAPRFPPVGCHATFFPIQKTNLGTITTAQSKELHGILERTPNLALAPFFVFRVSGFKRSCPPYFKRWRKLLTRWQPLNPKPLNPEPLPLNPNP